MNDSVATIGKFPTRKDRAIALCIHLSVIPSSLIVWGMGAAIIPLALWWILMTRSPIVDHHGRAGVNFALAVSFVSAGFWISGAWDALPVWVALIAWLCVSIVAIKRGRRGWLGRDIPANRWALMN